MIRQRSTRSSASSLLLVGAILVFLSGLDLLAQSGTGLVTGLVRDEQGATLPGAAVTLRNQESGVARTTTTDTDGRYRFPALGPGRYTARIELPGFGAVEAHDLIITIGLELKQDFTMRVQNMTETVNVTAQAPMVDTSKAEVAGVITQLQMEVLPINSRQYLSLALLMPGTSLDATRSFFPTVNIGGSLTFNSTTNMVDGMYNVWVEDGEPRQSLPEDAVEQFKVSNAQYKSEFGLATGGVLQVVTKSGTNAAHGTAFEYFRDKALNAKGVFETVKPAYRRHQFGGSVGGPIRRDRMHFFGAFERTAIDQFFTVKTGLPQVLFQPRRDVPAVVTHEPLSRAGRLADQQRAELFRALRRRNRVLALPGLRRFDLRHLRVRRGGAAAIAGGRPHMDQKHATVERLQVPACDGGVLHRASRHGSVDGRGSVPAGAHAAPHALLQLPLVPLWQQQRPGWT